MSEAAATVFVVDDSVAVRRSLHALFSAAHLDVETYGSGRDFLAAYHPGRAGCLVLDLHLRDENGLDLLEDLHARGSAFPIIVLTAHGSVAASVRALKAGAVDFLEKPAPPGALLARVRAALAIGLHQRETAREHDSIAQRVARLTPRERQVADLLVAGKRSKDIATAMRVSVRTVEGYRSRILLKMQACSATELVSVLMRGNVVSRT